MLVRLSAKLAEIVNGLDLSHCEEGDVIAVTDRDGKMLLAEGWAEQAPADEPVSCEPKHVEPVIAADEGLPGWRKAPPTARAPEQWFHIFKPSTPEHRP